MNIHWLVLADGGWRAFENETDAADVHCDNIEHGKTSYLVEGHTIDASGSDLCEALVHDPEYD